MAGCHKEAKVTLEAKLKAFKKEFPGFEALLTHLQLEWQERTNSNRTRWESMLFGRSEIKVERIDLKLLASKGFFEEGDHWDDGVHWYRYLQFFVVNKDTFRCAKRESVERQISFSLLNPSTWFVGERVIKGQTVRDLILSVDNPDYIVSVHDVSGHVYKITLFPPRGGMTLRQIAEEQQKIADAEVQEEIKKAQNM